MHKFFNEHKGARRLALLASYLMIAYASYTLLQPEIITNVNAASAAIVTTIFGVLGAPIMQYFHARGKQTDD